jgi:DnaJ-class molecular chaperone
MELKQYITECECHGRKNTCVMCNGKGELIFKNCPQCKGEPPGNFMKPCDRCDGKKAIHCQYCKGQGSVVKEDFLNTSTKTKFNVVCIECKGTGLFGCSNCDNNGEIRDYRPNCSHCKNDPNKKFTLSCDYCLETGETDCRKCDGKGKIVRLESIWDFKIRKRKKEKIRNIKIGITIVIIIFYWVHK